MRQLYSDTESESGGEENCKDSAHNFKWKTFCNIKAKAKQTQSKVRTQKIYTNTDTEGKTEIITHLEIKLSSKDRHGLEAKVDLGAEMNVLPLSFLGRYSPKM